MVLKKYNQMADLSLGPAACTCLDAAADKASEFGIRILVSDAGDAAAWSPEGERQ